MSTKAFLQGAGIVALMALLIYALLWLRARMVRVCDCDVCRGSAAAGARYDGDPFHGDHE